MSKKQYEIIDNYLPEEEFQKILNIVEDSGFTWSLAPKLIENSDPEDYYFTRVLIEYGKELFPNSSEIVKILLTPISKKLQKNLFVTRSKINLFLKEKEHKGYGMHQDVTGENSVKYNSLLFYLENSNGYTEFDDGDIVNSIRNRAIFFRSNVWHQTITSTDTLFRRNININYQILDGEEIK